jgi:hypothetical protein
VSLLPEHVNLIKVGSKSSPTKLFIRLFEQSKYISELGNINPLKFDILLKEQLNLISDFGSLNFENPSAK